MEIFMIQHINFQFHTYKTFKNVFIVQCITFYIQVEKIEKKTLEINMDLLTVSDLTFLLSVTCCNGWTVLTTIFACHIK